MINYSIAMRPVNSNLLEINQAKARIKAAKAAGQTPAPADVALVSTITQRAFAVAQYSDAMTIEKFARHIADHGSVYSRADIAAILYLAVDCIREQLLEGKKVRLGDLGDFAVTLTSRGAESAEKFTAQNITGINVVWEPGLEFRNLLADAQFNLVASRSAQAAVLKAIKAGQQQVDISTPVVTPSTGTDNDHIATNPTSYIVTVNSANSTMGSVSGGGTYAPGQTATLTATANSGYRFEKWSDGNTSNPRSLTVNANGNYTAQFVTTASSGTGGGLGD